MCFRFTKSLRSHPVFSLLSLLPATNYKLFPVLSAFMKHCLHQQVSFLFYHLHLPNEFRPPLVSRTQSRHCRRRNTCGRGTRSSPGPEARRCRKVNKAPDRRRERVKQSRRRARSHHLSERSPSPAAKSRRGVNDDPERCRECIEC